MLFAPRNPFVRVVLAVVPGHSSRSPLGLSLWQAETKQLMLEEGSIFQEVLDVGQG